MSKDFRWGIIGTGGIARTFARDLTFTQGHVVAAVGSRELSKAETFAQEFNAAPYGSYEELVQQEVDGVYVATPHPMHAPNTILALENGKPVLCEKPFAVNSRESAAMIETARRNNLLLVEAMWSRFLPTYRKIRDLMRSELLGEVQAISADFGELLPECRHHRLHSPALAGGSLLDLGIYPISFAFMLLGKPSLVTAKAEFTLSGVDSNTFVTFRYQNGARAELSCSLALKTPCTAEVKGTKGSLFIDGEFFRPTSMRLIRTSGESIEFSNGYTGSGLREQAIEFAKLISEGKKESDLMTHNDTQSIMETMDEIRSQIGLRYPFEN